MSSAMKCDVCGKFYDFYNANRNSKNPNSVRFTIKEPDGSVWCCDGVIDLCPECMERVMNHIKEVLPGKV